MAIGDVCRVELRMTQFGQRLMNVMHFIDADGTQTLADLLNKFDTQTIQGVNGYDSVASSALTFDSLRAVNLIPYGAEVTRSVGVTGSRAATAEVATTCGIISLSAGQAVRTKRGRMFIPGMLQTDTDQGLCAAAYTALLSAFAAKLVTDWVVVGGWNIGIFSRKIGGTVPPFNAAGFTAVTAIDDVTIPGVLARRKLGRGA